MSTLGPSKFGTTRDGRRLHYVSSGVGLPTVVFEAGMGSSRNAWALVLPEVARRTRVVAYDRSGLGLSPGDHSPRTLDRAATDLVDVLHHLGEGPFVLVGHSYGGPIVRTAAAAVPHLVCGLVLVDASDEGCDLYFSKAAMRRQRVSGSLLPVLARTRVLRAVVKRAATFLPPDARAELAAEDSTVEAARAFRAELEPFTEDMMQLRDSPFASPDYPVTLISGTKRPRGGGAIRAALIDAHARRASALPKGRHVRAERSGHLVMFSEPEIVVAETLRVVEGRT